MPEIDFAELSAMEKVEYVRATMSPLDLADVFELDEVRGKVRIPYNPDERTPSCHLYEDGWFDYSTGKGGDVIDLYMLLTGAPWGKALNKLLEGAVRADADPERIRRQPVELPDLTDQFFGIHGAEQVPEMWATRLTPVPHVLLQELTMLGRLATTPTEMFIPHWHGGVVRGIKVRNVKGQKSAVPGSTFAEGLYWPVGRPGYRTTLVITEGESDAWALLELGLQADIASLPSGAGLWKDRWLNQLTDYETIYTAFDNDRAGQQATEKVRSSIGWGRWAELKVPTLYKDVREAMAAGWEPKL